MKSLAVEPSKFVYNGSCNFTDVSLNFTIASFNFTIASCNFTIASFIFTIVSFIFTITSSNFTIASSNFTIASFNFTNASFNFAEAHSIKRGINSILYFGLFIDKPLIALYCGADAPNTDLTYILTSTEMSTMPVNGL